LLDSEQVHEQADAPSHELHIIRKNPVFYKNFFEHDVITTKCYPHYWFYSVTQEYLYEALDYVAKGKAKVIAETYPLHDIGRAYEDVAAGNVRFRAVINI
jgi:hypothetical protein